MRYSQEEISTSGRSSYFFVSGCAVVWMSGGRIRSVGAAGAAFTLKDGESIHIKYLPIGLRYTVKELDSTGYTVTNTVNGVVSSGGTASGTIIKDVQSAVVFTNTIGRVGLTLQKLDQDGKPLTGAVFQLKNANGDVMNFVRKDEKTYVVPTGRADYIGLSTAENPRSGSLYYIASAAHPEYVIGQASAGSHQDAKLQKKTVRIRKSIMSTSRQTAPTASRAAPTANGLTWMQIRLPALRLSISGTIPAYRRQARRRNGI